MGDESQVIVGDETVSILVEGLRSKGGENEMELTELIHLPKHAPLSRLWSELECRYTSLLEVAGACNQSFLC